MSEIKKGTLVKAWDNDVSTYVIGIAVESHHKNSNTINVNLKDDYGISSIESAPYKNAVEIPAELAKQLEELGQ
jgi:hypothetical protein